MRSISFLVLCLTSVLLWFACTAPVEQNSIMTKMGNQLLYHDKLEKTNLAWASDSSKLAFQTPVGLVTLMKYSFSGELLDTLLTLNVPFLNEKIAPVYLSPNGTQALYQKTEKRFNVVTLATGNSKSYRFPDLSFVSPMTWSDDGTKIYGATQENDEFFLTILDPQTSEIMAIELDSLKYCSEAQLYENNVVLYSGIKNDNSRGVWLKQSDGKIVKISSEDAGGMVYFSESGIVLCYQHDAELNENVIKKYSLADKSESILNDDFGTIWAFDRLPGEEKVQIGGLHHDARLGIYTLSVDGNVQQLSNWWPFEIAQWADDGQSVVVQKVYDDYYSAIYVYDLLQDKLVGLTDTAVPMQNYSPVFTPNSQSVIFSQNNQLVSVSANGGIVTPLTSFSTLPQFNPDVSPDGSSIACDDGKDIYILPAQGGELQKISGALNMSLTNPTWSPDGSKIACQTETTLEILSFDGQQLSEYKSYGGNFESIEWASVETPPFGAPIIYRKDQFSIAIINPETGHIIDSFSFSAELHSFCWAANGRDIIYTTPWDIVHTPLLSSLSQ